MGRVSKVDNRKSDLSAISTFEYEHDKVGNPTKITREDGSATYYEYDRIYQLTGETQVDDQGQAQYAFEYQYDKAHNRTVKVDNGTPTYYTYNAANELTEETTDGQTTYYHYDRCGNTVAKQEPSGTTYYAYDTENLMTRIDFADGSHNYFGYDADSKRVSARTSEGFTEFIYQGPDMLKLLLERDEEGETHAHYTMGNGLEAMRRANGGGIASGDSSFYHYNHLGTTHELTDADEDVTDTYRHDAWGETLARTGSTRSPHAYVGRERYYLTPDPGLHLLGLRYYQTALGRFVTPDPEGLGTISFSYVQNMCVVAIDPEGLLGVVAPSGLPKCKIFFWIGDVHITDEERPPEARRWAYLRAARESEEAFNRKIGYEVHIVPWGTSLQLDIMVRSKTTVGLATVSHGGCGPRQPAISAVFNQAASGRPHMVGVALPKDSLGGGMLELSRLGQTKYFQKALFGHCYSYYEGGEIVRGPVRLCRFQYATRLGVDMEQILTPTLGARGGATEAAEIEALRSFHEEFDRCCEGYMKRWA